MDLGEAVDVGSLAVRSGQIPDHLVLPSLAVRRVGPALFFAVPGLLAPFEIPDRMGAGATAEPALEARGRSRRRAGFG